MFGKDDDPYIILSKQILMSKYSDPKTISDFLISQSEIAINDFELTSLNNEIYLKKLIQNQIRRSYVNLFPMLSLKQGKNLGLLLQYNSVPFPALSIRVTEYKSKSFQ
jgi:hypothetical protein